MKQLLEEENAVLRTYNEQFGNENEQLIAENSQLKAEMAHSRQIWISRNNPQDRVPRPISPVESNVAGARVRIFFFLIFDQFKWFSYVLHVIFLL